MLKEKIPVDMMESLRTFSVCAVCPGDDIFPPSVGNTQGFKERKQNLEQEQTPISPPESFDRLSLKIYKKIPLSEPCELESLVDSETDLRMVMKCLLNLEVNGFVKMLPGEMVSRKFK